MARAFAFGDLVVCGRDDAPRDVGIVAELRRSDARILYLRTGHSLWAGLREMAHAGTAAARGTLEGLVADLIRMLGAVELEFSSPGPGRHRLIASHGAIGPEVLDRLRERLSGRLTACVVRPQGMHRIQTLVEFTLDPAGEDAGRMKPASPGPSAAGPRGAVKR